MIQLPIWQCAQDEEDVDMGAEVERRQEITAEKAYEILKRISDEDCEALGASHAPSLADDNPMVAPLGLLCSCTACMKYLRNHQSDRHSHSMHGST